MPLQDVETLASANIPEADGLIPRATGQGLSIRAETDRPDPIGVALAGQKWLAISDPPDPDLAIGGPDRQEPAIWAKGHSQSEAKDLCKNASSQVSPAEINIRQSHLL